MRSVVTDRPPAKSISDRRRQAPRAVDQPTVGFFLVRLVKGGPLIPAEIRCHGGVWSAVVNGEEWAGHTDPLKARGVANIYLGEKISLKDYQRRLKLKDKPGHPAADPRRPVDLTALPSIF